MFKLTFLTKPTVGKCRYLDHLLKRGVFLDELFVFYLATLYFSFKFSRICKANINIFLGPDQLSVN